jgi:O-antigen/teichoic acid export membrane protein
VPAALLQRDMRFKELAVRQVLATGLSVVAAVALALAGAGVWALVAQTLVRVGVACVVLWVTSDFRPRPVLSRADAREMLGYGTRSLGVTLGGAARQSGEPFLIGAVLGTVALGYWTVAIRLVSTIVDLCSAAMSSVSGPVFSELQDQPERLARTYGRILSVGAFVLVPVMTAMSWPARTSCRWSSASSGWCRRASPASLLPCGSSRA